MTDAHELAILIATIGFFAHSLYVLRDNLHALIEQLINRK